MPRNRKIKLTIQLINKCHNNFHLGEQVQNTYNNLGWFMAFNATFNKISVILWWSVLLVAETGLPEENHWPVASHWQTLSHNVVSSTPHHEQGSNSQL
jgi:hypothetical protein